MLGCPLSQSVVSRWGGSDGELGKASEGSVPAVWVEAVFGEGCHTGLTQQLSVLVVLVGSLRADSHTCCSLQSKGEHSLASWCWDGKWGCLINIAEIQNQSASQLG